MRREPISVVSFLLLAGLAADAANGFEVKINFQPSTAQIPEGYLPDYGEVFGDRGNGFVYGWDRDIQGDSRRRGRSLDQRYDTLVQMQESGPTTWEIELPNGGYTAFVACGDPSYEDQINTIDVEGTIQIDMDGRDNFDEYNVTVIVSDGRLTIKPAPGGIKCKLMFLHITKIALPKAHNPVPANAATHANTWVELSWTPGDFAALHRVYFSESLFAVFSGANSALCGTQEETSLVVGTDGQPYPAGLVPGTTYYWRIDEVNDLHPDSPWQGDLWSFTVPVITAYDPEPSDGAEFVEPNVTLRWEAGFGAESHTVYIDEDFNDVNDAADGTPTDATAFRPAPLAKGTVYYWRVDEFDGVNTHKGNIWSFTTIPDVPITDPNLLCWWKFDEIFGDIVVDSSGYDHFGTVHGASLEVNGRVGGALYFGGDGDHVVDEDAGDYLNGLGALTVCMWIRADEIRTDRGFIDCEEPDGSDQMVTMRFDAAAANYGGTNVYKMAVTSTPDWEQQLASSSHLQTTEWQHVAMTWSSGEVIRFYINGIENAPSGTSEPNEGGVITGCTTMIVGKGGKDQGTTAGWKGLIDDVRIYDIALGELDLVQVMRGESDLAWAPKPANGSTPDVMHVLPLEWLPGENAAEHDIYFGTDRNAVANSDTSDTTGVYRIRQAETSYTPPEGAAWGTGPYYWRVDEYNTDGTITPGRLWQFTVADFLLVDDFESYTDDLDAGETIFQTWIDGWGTETNGATVGYADPAAFGVEHFVETRNVHGGRQSMPYFYDNTLRLSEATLPLNELRDWTTEGVQTLSLWLKGYPASFLEEPAGTYTLSAAGADIGGQMDEFRYVYKQLSGPGSITAQVLSVDNTNEWAKAGVMIRRTLDPGAPFAAVYITPGYGCRFQGRLALSTDVTSDTPVATAEQTAITAPYWIKLERDNADNFNGYYSSDGVTWEPMAWNPQYISMPTDVYVGLALTSHNANAVCVAQFADVKTSGSVTPATWTDEAIGVDMPSNDPEPMYVALANAGAQGAAVYHPDPRAAQSNVWTEWTIDLNEFSARGVDLTDVNDMTIGLGNRDNPVAGGSGQLYFDDIRLYRSE